MTSNKPLTPEDKAFLTGTSTKTQGPYHQHDCSRCVFIGSMHTNEGLSDWWVHPSHVNGEIQTVLERHSDEGSDYNSYPVYVLNPRHAEAEDMQGRLGYSPGFIKANFMLAKYREKLT